MNLLSYLFGQKIFTNTSSRLLCCIHFADFTNHFCHPSFHSFCLLFNHNLSEVIVQNALMDPIMKNKNAYLVHVFEKVQKNICTFSITKVL